MADFNAIATAIATRFSAANVTAPSGVQNIREATHKPQGQIPFEPYVIVFPGVPELHYSGGAVTGNVDFPVRLYLWKIREQGRNLELVNKWMTSLYLQFQGLVHLNLSSYVAMTSIPLVQPGTLEWGGERFEGIEITYRVAIAEGLSPTA